MNQIDSLIDIKDHLYIVFSSITRNLVPNLTVSDRSLDVDVFALLASELYETEEIKIKYSEPIDDIYQASAGRSPYDILLFGEIRKTPFKILLNNKFGVINSNTKNDTTTYNNLLRLYLDIPKQRVKKGVFPNYTTIKRRVLGKELFAYALYVFDKDTRKFNLFYLEDINEDFYINPRNSMFQVKYKPSLRKKPMSFYTFIQTLLEESIRALKKRIVSAEDEKDVLIDYCQEIASLNSINQ